MDKKIQQDLQKYIEEHAKMQFNCYNLSKNCDDLGYPGFTHFFQVQAQDEFVHQRRIMNYLLDRSQSFEAPSVSAEKVSYKSITEILKAYVDHRTHFANITNEFANNAKEAKDYTTFKFYEWFSIDFYEEIAEINDLIDWLNMPNSNHYEIDKNAAKRDNPDTLAVVDPFAPHK
ncbi:ferritin-like domain-containing protein [Spiroplasma tabanidicola]|uniref:Ferritin n=1 Tax=Spiroplasma tabanidicola TaxID=324079 RepID=A0A6I6CC54_9MOLU|nr:ferritin-like domain-containing protein [Spiroplasma tabanidicola]QGS51692.1 ferritin [Spiroplasma tabanidicola]